MVSTLLRCTDTSTNTTSANAAPEPIGVVEALALRAALTCLTLTLALGLSLGSLSLLLLLHASTPCTNTNTAYVSLLGIRLVCSLRARTAPLDCTSGTVPCTSCCATLTSKTHESHACLSSAAVQLLPILAHARLA